MYFLNQSIGNVYAHAFLYEKFSLFATSSLLIAYNHFEKSEAFGISGNVMSDRGNELVPPLCVKLIERQH
jgi:hypothetical protein